MRNLGIAVLVVLLFSAQAIANEVVRLTEHIDVNGKRTVFETTKDILEKCPVWKMDREPPLPIHKAVEIAAQWIKKKHPKFTSVNIVSISLSKIWDQKYQDRWYYSIAANAIVDLDGIKASSYFSVMVLMEGTVVGPSSPKTD
jgi:hypothetical protein